MLTRAAVITPCSLVLLTRAHLSNGERCHTYVRRSLAIGATCMSLSIGRLLCPTYPHACQVRNTMPLLKGLRPGDQFFLNLLVCPVVGTGRQFLLLPCNISPDADNRKCLVVLDVVALFPPRSSKRTASKSSGVFVAICKTQLAK